MKDKEIIDRIEKTLITKMREDDRFIRYSYYELKVTEDLSDEDLDRFLQLIKIKLEKLNYTVLFTGAKFTYQDCCRTVEANELMIAIKDYKGM